MTSESERRWFPRRAVVAVLGSAAIVLIAAFGVEALFRIYVRFTSPEVVEWLAEDARIRSNNLQKSFAQWHNGATPPLWRSRGIRTTLAPDPARKRVLVLGDSFLWGDGHANINDVWWRQLERELRRRGYHVEVAAAGLSGFSTRQQLDAARAMVAYGKPDLIVWGFVTNDPDEGVFKLQAANRNQFFWMLNGALNKCFPLLMYAAAANGYQQWEARLVEPPNLSRYAATVRDVAAFLQREEIPGFFITLPVSPYVPPVQTEISSLFRESGIRWVETIEPLRRRHPPRDVWDGRVSPAVIFSEWQVNPVNGHPGRRAMRFYAVTAADEITRRYADVLGKPATLPLQAPRINDWIPAGMRVTRESDGVTLVWPGDDGMLRFPIGRKHVELALADATPLSAVRIAGTGLRSAHLYATALNAEGWDERRAIDLGERRGNAITWNLSPADINTLAITADFAGNDRVLRITLTGARP